MKAKVLLGYIDKVTKADVNKDDVIEVTKERFKEINKTSLEKNKKLALEEVAEKTETTEKRTQKRG